MVAGSAIKVVQREILKTSSVSRASHMRRVFFHSTFDNPRFPTSSRVLMAVCQRGRYLSRTAA